VSASVSGARPTATTRRALVDGRRLPIRIAFSSARAARRLPAECVDATRVLEETTVTRVLEGATVARAAEEATTTRDGYLVRGCVDDPASSDPRVPNPGATAGPGGESRTSVD
jgi:hypothetical protein